MMLRQCTMMHRQCTLMLINTKRACVDQSTHIKASEENESYVLLECPMNKSDRGVLAHKVSSINDNYKAASETDKLQFFYTTVIGKSTSKKLL